MKKLTATKGLEKEKWLMYRKRGIGGSDAGAVCGLNPYRTAMQVYEDKTTDIIVERLEAWRARTLGLCRRRGAKPSTRSARSETARR